MFTDCMDNFFKSWTRLYTGRWAVHQTQKIVYERISKPTEKRIEISFKNFELFRSVVKDCVEYSMYLLNRNKHKLENEKSLECKDPANEDKKIIKTYYQYIAIFTKHLLHQISFLICFALNF